MNEYYVKPALIIAATRAKSADVNNVNNAVDAGFDLVPSIATIQAAVDATAADVVTTNADVVLTNADATATALDKIATNADVVSTNADVVSTNADAVATALDKIATNADVVTTNADVVLTNADVVTAGNIAAAVIATSTSSLLIEIASKTFTTQASKQFAAGQFLLAASDADPTNFMHGQVTSLESILKMV